MCTKADKKMSNSFLPDTKPSNTHISYIACIKLARHNTKIKVLVYMYIAFRALLDIFNWDLGFNDI